MDDSIEDEAAADDDEEDNNEHTIDKIHTHKTPQSSREKTWGTLRSSHTQHTHTQVKNVLHSALLFPFGLWGDYRSIV